MLRLLCVLLLAALPSSLAAQGVGRIVGRVTDDRQLPVEGAQVSIVGARVGTATGPDGRYRLVGVPAGTHEVRVARIGQAPKLMPNVAVRAGEETVLDIGLQGSATAISGMTVSASRRAEKITDAPATVSVINSTTIDNAIGNTFVSALKEAKGLDFIQVGMTSVAINARGFNSAFNNRFLMVEDGRISVLPENGLPVGQFTPTPKVDIAGMEVLVGPGSALYGADASNGVLSIRTKDPRDTKGVVAEVTGGSRSYMDVQGRYANVFGNTGFKIAGEYQTAEDWENYLCYNSGGTIVGSVASKVACPTGQVSEEGLKAPISWDARVIRGTAAVVQYMGQNRFELNGGMSLTDGVGQTNVGRNQLDGWKYNVLQARYTTPHWYLNAYRSQSQSGTSYALNRYGGAQLTPANVTLSADSLRSLSDWPSNGQMYAAEVQGNYLLPMVMNTSAVFGAQYRTDIVSSSRQWLTDRNTGKDISNAQQGVYAQTSTPVAPWLDVVLAGRVDFPANYDAQFSPKAGVVVKPWLDQAFRVTFNRAYKSPTILQTDFFIPDWTSIISIYGNTGGFKTLNAAGDSLRGYGPMVPESNKTWEFGYKGVMANRLFVDGTYFRSDYENFMSPLTIVGNPFATAAAGGPTFAAPIENPGGNIPVNAQGRIVNPAGASPIVLIYYNLGNAKVSGVDLGATYAVSERLDVRGTLSTVGIDKLTVPAGASPEATALNSPSTKWTLGATARDIGPMSFGLTFRNVTGYYFRSGSNSGVIPTFGTLDASATLKFRRLNNAAINLGVSNLFSCTATDVKYKAGTAQPNMEIESESRGCGTNRKHVEMINMPAIGTMVFLGARIQR